MNNFENNFHPLVSIIIPVYNGSNYLKCAIDSALGQDYDNLEIIVVNDGSRDNTEEIARSYGNKIRYFPKENGGVATALNLAIQNARGEYISWLSHDDYYLLKKVSRQIEELGKLDDKKEKLIFSDTQSLKIYDGQEEVTGVFVLDFIHFGLLTKAESLILLFSQALHGCSLLIPKIAFEDIGYFDENLLTTQDYDLWFKFIRAGYCFFYLPETLVVGRCHNQQVSIKKNKILKYESRKLFRQAIKTFKSDIVNANIKDKRVFKEHLQKFRWNYGPIKLLKTFIPKRVKQFIKERMALKA